MNEINIRFLEPYNGSLVWDRPNLFGFRYGVGQADDRVEAVNDVAYDTTGVAPGGSKRRVLLNKMRPYQCDLNGSNIEYLQDDVRLKVGGGASDLTNPRKLQMVMVPDFWYRSYQRDGWNYVLFSEVDPGLVPDTTVTTQWKKINSFGYPRYRGRVETLDDLPKLLSYTGYNPTVSISTINSQIAAKNTSPNASLVPMFIYEAMTLLGTLELGRRNWQAYYVGITDASTSYADATTTGITNTLLSPSGEVTVEWQTGSFTKPFRWRFIENYYGWVWQMLVGCYCVYNADTGFNDVYMTRDLSKINTDSNYLAYDYIGRSPSANGWVKEMIPGTILPAETGGSSTTYFCDHYYTSTSLTIRTFFSGGFSTYGVNAGAFCLNSFNAPSTVATTIGPSLCIFY